VRPAQSRCFKPPYKGAKTRETAGLTMRLSDTKGLDKPDYMLELLNNYNKII